MTAISDKEFVDFTTAAAVEEKAKLRKHFGRFDMLFFLICTLVGLDTLGAVASNGAQAFTWLIFLAAFFFVSLISSVGRGVLRVLTMSPPNSK